MKSAREEFGPPPKEVEAKLTQKLHDLHQVRQIGQDLKQAGVTQDGKQTNLTLVKNGEAAPSVHKDKAVTPGDRPALSPCDGKMQANTMAEVKEAGQKMQDAGVTKSASQQFSPPAPTPSQAAPSQGKSR